MRQRKNPKTAPVKIAPTAPDCTRPTTPQDIRDMLDYFAKTIRERARGYAYRQDDPELARMYDLWWGAVDGCRRKNRPDLPDLPPLPGSNFFAGMANLADYCTKAAKRLGAADAKAPAPTTVDRAGEYIRKHPGSKAAVIAKAPGVNVTPGSFRAHVAPKLKELGFTSTPGCEGGYWPPEV